MAGGIDWFRWHHGSVNDPKFGLVAKRAGASVAEVIAVWACLLESASASEDRGTIGEQDFESIDFALGMDDGKAARIYKHMQDRSMIGDEGHVIAWEKRQPKREDDTAAERKRQQREREKAERDAHLDTQCRDMSHDVTQCHDREEERREEVNNFSVVPEEGVQAPPAKKPRSPSFDGQGWLTDRFVPPQVAADWLTLRRGKKALPTETAFRQVEAEAAKAGMPLADAVAMCCLRGWVGFKAEWAANQQCAPPGNRPPNLTEIRRATTAALTRTTIDERPHPTAERDITGESSVVS